MRCSYTKVDGSRCKAAALVGGKACHFHARPGSAAEAGRVGGRRRKILDPCNVKHFEVAKSPSDLLEIATETLGDVREARLDPRTGNCIGQLVGVCLSLMRGVDLEARITALEQRDSRRGDK